MKIDLLDLDVVVKHNYEGADRGGRHDDGSEEHLPAQVTITSVIVGRTEIISIIPEDQLRDMEREILENEY